MFGDACALLFQERNCQTCYTAPKILGLNEYKFLKFKSNLPIQSFAVKSGCELTRLTFHYDDSGKETQYGIQYEESLNVLEVGTCNFFCLNIHLAALKQSTFYMHAIFSHQLTQLTQLVALAFIVLMVKLKQSQFHR